MCVCVCIIVVYSALDRGNNLKSSTGNFICEQP